jgi:hypothetical protein
MYEHPFRQAIFGNSHTPMRKRRLSIIVLLCWIAAILCTMIVILMLSLTMVSGRLSPDEYVRQRNRTNYIQREPVLGMPLAYAPRHL